MRQVFASAGQALGPSQEVSVCGNWPGGQAYSRNSRPHSRMAALQKLQPGQCIVSHEGEMILNEMLHKFSHATRACVLYHFYPWIIEWVTKLKPCSFAEWTSIPILLIVSCNEKCHLILLTCFEKTAEWKTVSKSMVHRHFRVYCTWNSFSISCCFFFVQVKK